MLYIDLIFDNEYKIQEYLLRFHKHTKEKSSYYLSTKEKEILVLQGQHFQC
jgi:hypothetical protein